MNKYFQHLFDFINTKVTLSEDDKLKLSQKLIVEEWNKEDTIVNMNQTCGSLRFVISGIYRAYKIEDGKEITSYFSYQNRNPFVASFISLLTEKPSNEIVTCIESGKLLSIPYTDWKSLYQLSERINSFGRLMAEFNYLLAMERIESLQYQNATDRYNSFIQLYPNLLNLIPHHYIASYLGITPESLSRVRKGS